MKRVYFVLKGQSLWQLISINVIFFEGESLAFMLPWLKKSCVVFLTNIKKLGVLNVFALYTTTI